MLRLSLHRIESRLGAFNSPLPLAILSDKIQTGSNLSVRTLTKTIRDRIITEQQPEGTRALTSLASDRFHGGRIQRPKQEQQKNHHSSSSTNNNNIKKEIDIMTISNGRPEQPRRQTGTSAGNYAPAHAVPFNERSSMDHQYCDPSRLIQQELPSLPVPSLQQTMDRLKLSVAPFAMNSFELAETLELIDQFQASAGQKLDLLLKQKARQVENWMAHDWWMAESYLKCREPLMINSNPAMIYPNFTNMTGETATANGHQRGIHEMIPRLVSALVDCREAIRQRANLESISGGENQQAICFDQYNKVFGTTRIPELESDSIHIKDISSPLDTFKIIITHKNRFYELDLTDEEYTGSNRTDMQQKQRLDTIRNALEIIVSNQLEDNNDKNPTANHKGVGIFTSLPRDDLARAYRLLDQDALKAIDEAQFILCLDSIKDHYRVQTFLDEATNPRAIGKQILHADEDNIGNRWFDKTLQLIVVTDEKMENFLGAGINYEHTVSEAAVISRIIEYTFNKVVSMPESSGHTTMTGSLNLNAGSTIKKLFCEQFQDDNLDALLNEAKQQYNSVVNKLDLEVLNFAHYGKRAIKTWQFSPDSWIQVALSFAHYNLHGRLAPCYESASVRKFAYGRTETIRSLTQEVGEFCMNPSYESLQRAINSHKKLAVEASNGEGIDRVLMGYRLAFKEIRSGQWKWGLTLESEHGDDMSVNRAISLQDIFSDKDISIINSFMNNELIHRSKRFVLSTSQVSSLFPNTFMTYGPLVPEGYGCCYNPTNNQIIFAITANSCNPSLICSTSKYKTVLEESLLRMSDLVQQNYISKSKL